MTETTPTNETPQPAQTKAGRGPTRPAIVAADMIDHIVKRGVGGEFVRAISIGTTSSELLADAKSRRKLLAEYHRTEESEIEETTALAGMLVDAARLPHHMLAFVVAAVTPPVTDSGAEDPAS